MPTLDPIQAVSGGVSAREWRDRMPMGQMESMGRTSHLSGGNLAYIEALYERYLEDASDVPAEWRDYFDKLPPSGDVPNVDVPHGPVRAHFESLGRQRPRVVLGGALQASADHERKQMRLAELISAYRSSGHKRANLDPLGMLARPATPQLELSYHQLTPADSDTVFQTGSLFYGAAEAKLSDIVAVLERTYCSTIGAEYMHIVDAAEQRWVPL